MLCQFNREKIVKRWLTTWNSQIGLVIALLVTCIVLTFLRPHFLSVANLTNVVRQVSINGILAVGVTFVLLSGGVDLSLGSMVALTGVAAAHLAHPGGYPLMVPVMAGILVGAACGAINGVVITRGNVAPFIATLGMMTVARGGALVLSHGRPVSNMSPAMTRIAGDWSHIPIPALILAAISLWAAWMLKNTRQGRYLYAVGGNEKAARAAGINVRRVKFLAYVLCGALAGLAGVVLAARITTGQPNAGVAYELDAIAAVVIGGTSLSGGLGGVGGTLLGVLLMGVIGNGLDLLNVSSYYQQIVKGVIIIGAVWFDRRHQSSGKE
ncbi:MAG: ABC transporter permease [Kiritimatiellae bacterium]|jgi:ribose/xylose/arabinose/galactoside ABC-type transport system permease subunit|nr:ABC transporter permease [Kiritimatiellia bacterium]